MILHFNNISKIKSCSQFKTRNISFSFRIHFEIFKIVPFTTVALTVQALIFSFHLVIIRFFRNIILHYFWIGRKEFELKLLKILILRFPFQFI